MLTEPVFASDGEVDPIYEAVRPRQDVDEIWPEPEEGRLEPRKAYPLVAVMCLVAWLAIVFGLRLALG